MRLHLSMDGASVHLTRGRPEMRLGAVYETEEVVGENGEVKPRTINPTYIPRRGNVETFGRLAYLEAARRRIEEAAEVINLGDGVGVEWICR